LLNQIQQILVGGEFGMFLLLLLLTFSEFGSLNLFCSSSLEGGKLDDAVGDVIPWNGSS
jgi:hypothetical protein